MAMFNEGDRSFYIESDRHSLQYNHHNLGISYAIAYYTKIIMHKEFIITDEMV
ncbi:MAG TPA: hypothetical protein V6C58_22360 [Allocoleopsis sp.]